MLGGEAQSEVWVRIPEGSGTSDSALVPPTSGGRRKWPPARSPRGPGRAVATPSPAPEACGSSEPLRPRVCTCVHAHGRTCTRVQTRVRRAGRCWGARGGEGRLRAAAGGLLGTACKAELIPQPSGWLPGSGGPPSGTRPGPPRARAFRGPEPPSPRAAADAAPIWRPVPPGRTGGPRDGAFLGQGPLAWPGPPGSLAEWEPGRQAARWVLGVTAP